MNLEQLFTPRVQEAIDLARSAALKQGHAYVTPAHMLLGILEQRDGPIERYLSHSGADAQKALAEARALVSAAAPGPQNLGYDQAFEKLLLKASDTSEAMSEKKADVKHLLLAILEDTALVAVFVAAGTTRDKLVKV